MNQNSFLSKEMITDVMLSLEYISKNKIAFVTEPSSFSTPTEYNNFTNIMDLLDVEVKDRYKTNNIFSFYMVTVDRFVYTSEQLDTPTINCNIANTFYHLNHYDIVYFSDWYELFYNKQHNKKSVYELNLVRLEEEIKNIKF